MGFKKANRIIGGAILLALAGLLVLQYQAGTTTTPSPVEDTVMTQDTAVAVPDGEIEGIVWQATELNGKPVAEGAVITMQLTDGRIAGKSACNRYTGPYTLDAPSRSLKVIGPVAGTRMACPPELMEIEAAFNDVLPTITAYRVEDGSVLTVFAGTDEVLRLAQQPAE